MREIKRGTAVKTYKKIHDALDKLALKECKDKPKEYFQALIDPRFAILIPVD